MSLENPRTIEQYIKRTLEQKALDLIIAVRVGATAAQIQELTRSIHATGERLE